MLDAVDQSIFQAMGYDPPGYQGYDKAMDVYYLAMAYLSTLRNWSSVAAYRVARFLYFYRLVGVVAFELTGVARAAAGLPEHLRVLLHRLRGHPVPVADRALGAALVDRRRRLHLDLHQAAAGVVDPRGPARLHGLPRRQRLGRADHRGRSLLVAVGAFWVWGRPRLLPADHAWRFAADPLPEEMDTAAEQSRAYAEQGAVWSTATLEKVVLLGLLSVIFAQTLPGVEASNLQLFIGIAAVVVVNAAFTLALARRSRTLQSTALAVRRPDRGQRGARRGRCVAAAARPGGGDRRAAPRCSS